MIVIMGVIVPMVVMVVPVIMSVGITCMGAALRGVGRDDLQQAIEILPEEVEPG
jgi:hypothetical protein